MAAPQGGLGQASAQTSATAKAPALDVDAKQAELLETKKEPTGLQKVMVDLDAQRNAMNEALLRMRQSLDERKNKLFDPVLMQTAAGFLKPTKTGSFGESLGYAAENAGAAAEKQQIEDAQNQKLEMELMEKQQAFNQQNAMSSYRAGKLGLLPTAGTPAGEPSAGAPSVGAPPAPSAASGALSLRPGQLPSSVAGRASPAGGAIQRPAITDREIEESYLVDPSGKLAKELTEMAKLQREDTIVIDNKPYSKSRQEFGEGNPDTVVERDFGRYIGTKKVPYWFSKQYDEVLAEAKEKNQPELVFDFFKKYDMLEPPRGKDAAGKPFYETPKEKENREAIIQERLKAQVGEEKSQITFLETNARLSRDTMNVAKDIRATAEANPRAFDLLNNPGIADAVKRAAERGITAGSLGNFSIPTRELETYRLDANDRQALQLMAQKLSQLTVQFRKSARAPGEGATTESEGRLYAELGALPSDTAKVIRLKMEALEEKAKFDQQVFKVWTKFSKNPENTYRDFLASGYEEGTELNKVMQSYDSRLEKIRSANADLFRTAPKSEAAPAAPSATPAKPAPAGETYSQRLERLKKEGK